MLDKKIQDAINDQINKEMYSAYLYLAMSAYCEAGNLPGFAHWLRLQYQEELSHAGKFFDYVNDRAGRVRLQAIPEPPAEFKSPLAVFEQVLEHERQVTASINQLYALALKANDYATQVLLQWFINEQVEEEKNAEAIVERMRIAGEQGPALILMDRQLAARGAGS